MVTPVNVWDYEELAEAKLDANAQAYFVGGSGDEVTLRDNLAAFERRKLRPRVLVGADGINSRVARQYLVKTNRSVVLTTPKAAGPKGAQ